jgi:glutathione synthase/RimK-type ligase-like ATP-grasp enzyme
MQRIYILVDYKNYFGSKYNAVPYRSGMNKELILNYFQEYGFESQFLNYTRINFREINLKNQFILYTSSEDKGDFYKSYLEDICYGLALQGAYLIPKFVFLRAHNNKIFMEILRDLFESPAIKNIQSQHFGTLEELKRSNLSNNHKTIIKSATGSMGRGVSSGINKNEIIKEASKLSRTRFILNDWRDYIRSIRHKGYIRNSKNRQKFILQNFISGLINDWKILIFDLRYYVLYRGSRKNDFRASGSGNFNFEENVPSQVLDYAEKIYHDFNVPNLSLDIAFDGNHCYLFEFQALFFGTTTIEKSPFYFIKEKKMWKIIKNKSELEKEYVKSIVNFIKDEKYKKNLKLDL